MSRHREKRADQFTTGYQSERHALIATTEDWAPSLEIDGTCRQDRDPGGFVQVTKHYYDGKLWRLVARGGDDTLMELDGEPEHLESVLRRLPSVVTMAALRGLGFNHA